MIVDFNTYNLLEGKNYKYRAVAIRVESESEMNRVIDEISALDKDFHIEFQFEIQFPNFIVIYVNVDHLGKHEHICIWDSKSDEEGMSVDGPRHGIDPHIYSVGELSTVKRIILYGDATPSYRPRRVDRTLEGAGYHPYRFKTLDEMISQYGENWREHEPNTYFCDEMDYLLGTVLEENFPDEADEITISGAFSEDMWWIARSFLTRNEPKIPDYSPRRTTRTLESVRDRTYNVIVVEIPDRSKNEPVQRELFRQGYRWSISGEQIRNFDNYPTYLFVEDNDNSLSYTSLGRESGMMSPYRKIDEYITHLIRDYNENVCTTVFKHNEIGNMAQLFRFGKATPSYSPRRTTRTLEGYVNRYDYDVHDSYYFRKYNTFLAVFNKYMDLEVFHNVINMLSEVFDDCLRTKFSLSELKVDELPPNQLEYIVSFRYDSDSDKWYTGWSLLKDIDDYTRRNPNMRFPRYFKYNEINTWDKLRGVLDTGNIPPSYSPKRKNRVLESFIPDGYPHEGLVVKVENIFELRSILEYFYKKFKIENDRDLVEITDTFSMMYNPRMNSYILVLLEEGEFMMVQETMVQKYIDAFGLDHKIYSVSDLNKFNRNLQIGPTYSPRRIDRTMESHSEQYPYNNAVFRINNKTEYEYVLTRLFDKNIHWAGNDTSLDEVCGYPMHLFVDFTLNDISYYSGDEPSISEYISLQNRLKKYDNSTNPKIFDWKDVDRLNYVKMGGNDRPSYAPRRITRDL